MASKSELPCVPMCMPSSNLVILQFMQLLVVMCGPWQTHKQKIKQSYDWSSALAGQRVAAQGPH